ncbi:F-box protein PP2-B11 [Cinnamomum micranthum f. kanehirae]|uniref:F-box protein PP2-B11 n=1 Tax=Cinnamomum micranthum f. kanehirae TaxID=337451 RepID=A0A443Q0R0_9MAGN|nr:F-box protein PP2-B11 [Cinnamomum micranthum f. kanehirae]
MSVKLGGHISINKAFFQQALSSRADGQDPQARGDQWMEIEMGEFFNDDGEEGDLVMIFRDIRDENRNSGIPMGIRLIVEGIEIRPVWNNLPEDCISRILSFFTSPRDVCRSSAVCSIFRSASESDVVWEKFLPPDYPDILAGFVPPLHFSSKKELFIRLCDPIMIDDGKMSFSIDKMSCRKCYMLSARKLGIIWGADPRYWSWTSHPESRFHGVAELLQVCWLHIYGKIDAHILSPKTTYKVYLVIKFREDATGLNHAETWVKLGSHESKKIAFLQEAVPAGVDGQVPQARSDGWMEIEMGEFFNDEGEDGDVEMTFKQTTDLHWKSGLIIQGMEIREIEMEGLDLFSKLPEGCISHIISFTSHRDACRSSAVCSIFRAASESDSVWERFLPPDYPDVLAGSVSPPVRISSKKELFFRLCDPVLIDDNKMSFSIEKRTGRKCYTLSARKLWITWGDTPMYWKWTSLPESRFPEVAELLDVWWLEISGKIDAHLLSPKTTYKAYLVIKLGEEAYGLDYPAETSIKLGDHASNKIAILQQDGTRMFQS